MDQDAKPVFFHSTQEEAESTALVPQSPGNALSADTDLEDTEPNLLWQDYSDDIAELCQVKAEEFHLLGYEEVSAEEVWECAKSSAKGQVRLHDMVALVMGLQIGKFMNWMTMRAYKGTIGGDVFSP